MSCLEHHQRSQLHPYACSSSSSRAAAATIAQQQQQEGKGVGVGTDHQQRAVSVLCMLFVVIGATRLPQQVAATLVDVGSNNMQTCCYMY
jgi:hypothetical protein